MVMTRRFVKPATTALLLAAMLAGCSSGWEPNGPPALVGEIVARDVRISFGDPPTIHVKDPPDEECGIIFLVTSSTRIRRRVADGSIRAASVSDLTVGTRVGVWADVVLDSCPGQSSAIGVEIVEPAP